MLGTFPRISEAKRVVIDVETYDPLLRDKGVSYVYGEGYILGVGIKLDSEPASYYPVQHSNTDTLVSRDTLRSYLCDISDGANVLGHYSVYDFGWLKHELGWMPKNPRCTLLQAQLENNSYPSYALDALGQRYGLGEKMDIGDRGQVFRLPIMTVAKYCCQDLDLTAKLDDKLWEQRDSEAGKRENALIPILVEMKARGIKIDQERLWALQKYYSDELSKKALGSGVRDIWVANKVMGLFNNLNITDFPRTPKTNQPSFPDWYLDSYSHIPEIKALHEARKLQRLIAFCINIRQHIADDGNIHPDLFNGRSEFGGTITGRFSCGNPNVQQIPHRTEYGSMLRSAFIPSDGYWFKFDYSQQEPRLMLHYASKLNLQGIQRWRDYYINSDADFYTFIQQAMNVDRFSAKTISLARCYNMGYGKLSRMVHISEDIAKQYLLNFDRSLPWLPQLKDYCQNTATNRKWIKTLGGRKLYFDSSNTSDSFNHLIQGSAADQIKEAMIRIYKYHRKIPMLQVHDELAIDMEDEHLAENIEQTMIEAFKLDFPTKVDVSVGRNWREAD